METVNRIEARAMSFEVLSQRDIVSHSVWDALRALHFEGSETLVANNA